MVNLCYIKILIQILFQIWFCIPALHWAGNNIYAQLDLIQSGINLQYITKGHVTQVSPGADCNLVNDREAPTLDMNGQSVTTHQDPLGGSVRDLIVYVRHLRG